MSGSLLTTTNETGAVLKSAHNLCFKQKLEKKITFFHLKIIVFIAVKYCCILHGRVCVMTSLGADA